jgi:hypothetical protein
VDVNCQHYHERYDTQPQYFKLLHHICDLARLLVIQPFLIRVVELQRKFVDYPVSALIGFDCAICVTTLTGVLVYRLENLFG